MSLLAGTWECGTDGVSSSVTRSTVVGIPSVPDSQSSFVSAVHADTWECKVMVFHNQGPGHLRWLHHAQYTPRVLRIGIVVIEEGKVGWSKW